MLLRALLGIGLFLVGCFVDYWPLTHAMPFWIAMVLTFIAGPLIALGIYFSNTLDGRRP